MEEEIMQLEDFSLSNVITVTVAVLSSIAICVNRFFAMEKRISVIEKDSLTSDQRHKEHELDLIRLEEKIMRSLERVEDKIENYILKTYTDGKS